MLERAFIVTPASSAWGGSALVNERGEVVGIGSLRLGEAPYTNLFIPLERFVPVKDEIIATGRVQSRTPRPWLGLYTSADDDGITVDGFSPIGPAAQAGFLRGDRIVGVNGVNVHSQEEFYETLWKHRAGEVISSSVTKSSGNEVLDHEALAILRRASPFPPFPAAKSGGQDTYIAPVNFSR